MKPYALLIIVFFLPAKYASDIGALYLIRHYRGSGLTQRINCFRFEHKSLRRMGISKSQIGAMVVNGLLILFGILMVALAFHLINEHHMTSLYFLSSWLYTFPMTLIILGMFNVVIAFAAIIAASIRNKYGLIVCAIFVLLLVLPQFFSIWAANRVKEDTDEKAFLQPLFTV